MCATEREREMGRGCCVSHAGCLFVVRPFPLLETDTHTHIFQRQRHVAFATISTWSRDSVPDLWLPNIPSIPPSVSLLHSLINRSTSGTLRWIFHCQNLISCFWFYFISFWFCFILVLLFFLFSSSPSFISFLWLSVPPIINLQKGLLCCVSDV